ncbi:ly6/PLAUR domain-containing protein 3-like [Apteryx mantelli]|uniref:Ly6/PLAUR domain-containing protein 3-like n=1 Tax=Apteryx mantelli TaxID=2696672 RepID=A0ABM4G760_9AVES
MGPAWGWALLAALLGPGSCLRCLQCADEACAPVTCAAHESRCRATVLTTVDAPPRAPQELRREERGCAPALGGGGGDNVTGGGGDDDVTASVTFLSRGQLVTLQELLCRGDMCNAGPAPRPRAHPDAALECFTCSEADGSCSAPALRRLRCPDPRDRCLELTARLGPAGGALDGGLRGGGRCLTRTPGPFPRLTRDAWARAVGLTCLSCVEEGDGGCRPEASRNVTCDAESSVCAEALGAVTWSHGRFAVGARGCARGAAGTNDRALELFGLVVFAQRHQCGDDGCNRRLPLGRGALALPLPGNESARVPNGVSCYGCPDDGPCPASNATVVQCYDDFTGCFHGNVTLTLGSVSLWREVRGCVRDGACTRAEKGGGAVGLRGSCCAGSLCNRDLTNKTFFAPDLPRLELLPHGHGPTAPHNATARTAATHVAAAATATATTTTTKAAATTDMAAATTNMAATTTNMAASTGAPSPTMAAPAEEEEEEEEEEAEEAEEAAGGRRFGGPMGRKQGAKGPQLGGRGAAVGLGAPAWLLPSLLILALL